MSVVKIRSLVVSILMLWIIYPISAIATTFTSWNIEWLSSSPSAKFSESHRSAADVQKLNQHFIKTKSDVLAFQEVNDPQIIGDVVGSDYQLFFSDRSQRSNRYLQFEDINQYTGFAVKKGIPTSDPVDFPLDAQSGSKLRFATYIVLYPNSEQPIHALSVHMKARCAGAYRNDRHCKMLKSQGGVLNKWIKERERQNQAYVILGDFNHNLSYSGDWLWQSITKSTNASLATQLTPADCKVRSRKQPNKTHQFRSLIDHIIVSDKLTASNVQQVTFNANQVLSYHLSDHCPIQAIIK